jgi:hypothetical protein
MTTIGVLMLGLLLVYLGGTDKVNQTYAALTSPAYGYAKIPILRFLIGLGVVSIPVVILDRQGENDWINRYVLLITLSVLIFNANYLRKFTNYIATI